MDFGSKISYLRKKNNMSQESLAELLDITRQTLSKWELNETTPDINQAKKLSKIFNVSLDELTDNNITNVIVEKVSNTERLALFTIKILKFIGIVFVIGFITLIIEIVVKNIKPDLFRDNKVVGKYTINCTLDTEKYLYEVEYNKNYLALNIGGDAFIANHIDIDKYNDANQIIAHIEDYFKNYNGTCIIKDSK